MCHRMKSGVGVKWSSGSTVIAQVQHLIKTGDSHLDILMSYNTKYD